MSWPAEEDAAFLAAADGTGATTIAGASETADLLARIEAFVARFVVLPNELAAVAVALSVLHTWAIEGAHATPYLVVVSPERRTGKSRLLEVLTLLVRSAWHTVGTSEAALFRKINQDTPTLLLDEIDAVFGSSSERTEPLRAILCGGNRRGATVTRCVGQGTAMRAEEFTVFCPKVLAGIDTGKLPDTIKDRAIVLHMKRRHSEEQVERFRERDAAADAKPITEAAQGWAERHTGTLHDARPFLPYELNDRAADAWEPLLAIADVAGGEWPARARKAALALGADDGADEASRGAQVLEAARQAMSGRDMIATSELLEAINSDDELPFGAWREGSGLDARTLAKLLKPYGVKPRTVRIGGDTPKGYRAEDLRDAWARYLTPQEAQQAQQAQHDTDPQLQPPRNHWDVADVADVAAVAGVGGDVADNSAAAVAHAQLNGGRLPGPGAT
jgi:hypothetical protein